MKKIAGKWLNMLKIRYSYGKTGNDALYEGNERVRFPYLYSIATDNNVYHFEDIGTGDDGKQEPPPEIELPPDDKIEVDKPELPPNPDGGGIGGNVDGWGPEDGVELPVN